MAVFIASPYARMISSVWASRYSEAIDAPCGTFLCTFAASIAETLLLQGGVRNLKFHFSRSCEAISNSQMINLILCSEINLYTFDQSIEVGEKWLKRMRTASH